MTWIMNGKRIAILLVVPLLMLSGCGGEPIPYTIGGRTDDPSMPVDLTDGQWHDANGWAYAYQRFATPDGEVHCIVGAGSSKAGLSCWKADGEEGR